MNKFLHYTITVPLLALPIATFAPKWALAGISSPVQALEILARNKEIAGKCKQLSAAEYQELSDYAARAELVVARRNSVADAQAAITIGKAKGSAATCGEATLTEIRDTLTAARRAMASLPAQTAEDDGGLVIENKTALSMRPSLIETAPPADVARIGKPKLKVSFGMPQGRNLLERYKDAATAYYVERRCGHLSQRQAQEFWNRIVGQHNEVLTRSKRSAVAATLQSAQVAANIMTCGAQTAEMVHQGYAAVRTP